jgi:hypothetical protein
MLSKYARQVGHESLELEKLLSVGRKICEKME